MTTRRYQLVTREGRLRVVRAAGAYLLERAAFNLEDVDRLPDLPTLAGEVSSRLFEVGLTNATESILTEYASALDFVDGLTSGRYEPDLWGWAGGPIRDGLIRGYEGVVDYCEGLAVLPI